MLRNQFSPFREKQGHYPFPTTHLLSLEKTGMLVEIAFTVDYVEHFEIAESKFALKIVRHCQIREIDPRRRRRVCRGRRQRSRGRWHFGSRRRVRYRHGGRCRRRRRRRR